MFEFEELMMIDNFSYEKYKEFMHYNSFMFKVNEEILKIHIPNFKDGQVLIDYYDGKKQYRKVKDIEPVWVKTIILEFEILKKRNKLTYYIV